MKQFAIKINSYKEYNKVKAYAEKWGYKRLDNEEFISNGFFLTYEDNTFNDHNFSSYFGGQHIEIDYSENWRKQIRENSPLKLENIFVKIDTVERVKEVWDIIESSGQDIREVTKRNMSIRDLDKDQPFLHFYDNEFVRTRIYHEGKTEITPKQLAQILGVKRDNNQGWKDGTKISYGKRLNSEIDFIGKELKILHERIDKLERVSNLIKDETISIPKIAIRVENEQEFNDLMKIYDVLGWKWVNGKNSSRFSIKDYPNNIRFSNNHTQLCDKIDYTIIPFSQIKNLK